MTTDEGATVVICDGPRRCHGRVLAFERRRIVVDLCGVAVAFNARTGRAVSPEHARFERLAPASRTARGGA